jgi:hypothetical protein
MSPRDTGRSQYREDRRSVCHLLYADIQRNGIHVVFRATLSSGGDGVFLGDGLTTTTIATTGDTYSAFTASVPNGAGNVALMVNLTAGAKDRDG